MSKEKLSFVLSVIIWGVVVACVLVFKYKPMQAPEPVPATDKVQTEVVFSEIIM